MVVLPSGHVPFAHHLTPSTGGPGGSSVASHVTPAEVVTLGKLGRAVRAGVGLADATAGGVVVGAALGADAFWAAQAARAADARSAAATRGPSPTSENVRSRHCPGHRGKHLKRWEGGA